MKTYICQYCNGRVCVVTVNEEWAGPQYCTTFQCECAKWHLVTAETEATATEGQDD